MLAVEPQAASAPGLVALSDPAAGPGAAMLSAGFVGSAGLADLPEPVLHQIMSLLEARDVLRLRAVSRGLAEAVHVLPGGIFAELSICLPDSCPDSSLEGQQCVRSTLRHRFVA